jgi:hypothetical protein
MFREVVFWGFMAHPKFTSIFLECERSLPLYARMVSGINAHYEQDTHPVG